MKSAQELGQELLALFEMGKPLNVAEVRRLVAAGADVNAQDANGMTPLTCAVVVEDPDPELIDFLVAAGADIHMRDDGGGMALHWAASCGLAAMCEKLLDHGADINALNRYDYTPLIYAAHVGSMETVQCLIDRGANPHYRHIGNKNAMDVCLKNAQEMKAILNDAAQKTKPPVFPVFNADTSRQECAQILIREVRQEKPDISLIRALLQKKPDLGAKDECGDTALHYACERGRSHRDIIDLLIENKAPLDAQNSAGDTPLMIASHEVPVIDDVVEKLVNNGASLHIKNRNGMTAYDFASKGQYTAILTVLDKAFLMEKEKMRQQRGAYINQGLPTVKPMQPLPRLKIRQRMFTC